MENVSFYARTGGSFIGYAVGNCTLENSYAKGITFGIQGDEVKGSMSYNAGGLEYGMQLIGGGMDAHLPACVQVENGDVISYIPATPAPNGQFAIRVYIKGLTKDTTYTMTPYIGTPENYIYGDTSDEYTVTVD